MSKQSLKALWQESFHSEIINVIYWSSISACFHFIIRSLWNHIPSRLCSRNVDRAVHSAWSECRSEESPTIMKNFTPHPRPNSHCLLPEMAWNSCMKIIFDDGVVNLFWNIQWRSSYSNAHDYCTMYATRATTMCTYQMYMYKCNCTLFKLLSVLISKYHLIHS